VKKSHYSCFLKKYPAIRSYIPRENPYITTTCEKTVGGISLSNKRFNTAHLVCRYLKAQNITHAEVTARDIASFHQMPGTFVPTISALLNFLQRNHIRKSRYGFFVSGTQASRKSGYPHRFIIELMDAAYQPSARV
jgi:hypothetical protein